MVGWINYLETSVHSSLSLVVRFIAKMVKESWADNLSYPELKSSSEKKVKEKKLWSIKKNKKVCMKLQKKTWSLWIFFHFILDRDQFSDEHKKKKGNSKIEDHLLSCMKAV